MGGLGATSVRLAGVCVVSVLIDDVTAASTNPLFLCERCKRRERHPKELTEPGIRDCRARLAKEETRGVSGRAVHELFLAR